MARASSFTAASLGALLQLGCGGSGRRDGGPAKDAAAANDAPACSLAPHTPSDWRLAATGTTLKDSLGRTVFLRGVNAGGRSKFAPYVPFDYGAGQYAAALGAYMDRAASWGIDVMRVPFTWAALEPTQGHDDPEWLARFDQLLDAAWARGIYTVLDFHQDVYSEAYCGDGFPLWTLTNPPSPHHDCPQWSLEYFSDSNVAAAYDRFWASGSSVQAAYLSAWDVMVARYKDRPGVLGFEPFNEPGWGSADESTFSATVLTSFYSMMVARMRAAAPTSLVFVDLPGLDGATLSTHLGRPQGDGIVFAPHFYPLGADPAAVQSGLQKWVDIGTSWNVPVFVGEFGVGRDQSAALDFVTANFAAFDALGIGGTEWEYSVSADVWNSETFDLVAADGTAYPVAQAVLRPYARAVAGDVRTQSYDPSSHTFVLEYAPGSGVTEISLPAPAYPSGYGLAVSGACVDAASEPGRLLLQPDGHASQVSLRVTPK